jgi:hypothetical protein
VYPATVDFGWDAVAGAGLYHVQVAQGATTVVDERVSTTYLHGIPLVAGDYQWRVAADQSVSHPASPWSDWRPFTVS